MSRTIVVTFSLAIFFGGLLSGCGMLTAGAVAIGESRRANSPEAISARDAAGKERAERMEKIKNAAVNGSDYAKIELARKCFETDYPCVIAEPGNVFREYSERGFDIATYYYASFRLGLDPWGYTIEHCKKTLFGKCQFLDSKVGAELMSELTQKGCEYEVQAFERRERIYPCSRLKEAKR